MGSLEKRMVGIVGVLGACWEMLFRVRANRREGKGVLRTWFGLFQPLPTPSWEEKIGKCRKI